MVRFPVSGIIHVTDEDAVVLHVQGFVVPSLTRRTLKFTLVPRRTIWLSVVEVSTNDVNFSKITVEFTRFGIAVVVFLNIIFKI